MSFTAKVLDPATNQKISRSSRAGRITKESTDQFERRDLIAEALFGGGGGFADRAPDLFEDQLHINREAPDIFIDRFWHESIRSHIRSFDRNDFIACSCRRGSRREEGRLFRGAPRRFARLTHSNFGEE
ncbi:MAG: hypothetical protein ACKVX9_07110 [Blastocatellia bacterium]